MYILPEKKEEIDEYSFIDDDILFDNAIEDMIFHKDTALRAELKIRQNENMKLIDDFIGRCPDERSNVCELLDVTDEQLTEEITISREFVITGALVVAIAAIVMGILFALRVLLFKGGSGGGSGGGGSSRGTYKSLLTIEKHLKAITKLGYKLNELSDSDRMTFSNHAADSADKILHKKWPGEETLIDNTTYHNGIGLVTERVDILKDAIDELSRNGAIDTSNLKIHTEAIKEQCIQLGSEKSGLHVIHGVGTLISSGAELSTVVQFYKELRKQLKPISDVLDEITKCTEQISKLQGNGSEELINHLMSIAKLTKLLGLYTDTSSVVLETYLKVLLTELKKL